MDESLLPDNYNNNINRSSDALSVSEASLQRSASLLARIQAQRERETMDVSSFGEIPRTLPEGVPQYEPLSSESFGNDRFAPAAGRSMMGASSLNFSGLIRGFGNRHNNEATRGLLDATSPEEYSMENYFRTFVMDVYNFYRSLPIPVQAGGIVLMLWIIYKCI
jgi:hypothetical protein